MGERRLSDAEAAYARSLVIFEDRSLIAFDKPAGLAAQGGSGIALSLDVLLQAFATSKGRIPRLAHRLDLGTSGVIVAGRTKPATAALSQAFAERTAQKAYLAVVCGGAPNPPAGLIDHPLRKVSKAGGLDQMQPCAADAPGAQAAVTAYETLSEVPGAALMRFAPQTGRMHQLRAHAALVGRPIAGDGKYGGLFNLKGVVVTRLLLHAGRLSLPHPDGGTIVLAAPAPRDFQSMVAEMGLTLSEDWKNSCGRI